MNIKSIFVTLVFIHFSLYFSGCGYKPSSHYAKDAIKGSVYVHLSLDIDNSRNAILVKDAINEIIINQFHSPLTANKDNADTIVSVKLSSVSHKAIETDDEGYTKSYRTSVSIELKYDNKLNNKSDTIKVSNYYDYSVDNDSVVTEQKKQEAVRLASSKALRDIFSKIAIRNMKK